MLKSARDLGFLVEAFRLDSVPVLPSLSLPPSSLLFPALKLSENGEHKVEVDLYLYENFLYELNQKKYVNRTFYLPALLNIIRLDTPLYGLEFLTIDGLSYTYLLSSLLRDSFLSLLFSLLPSSLPSSTSLPPPTSSLLPPSSPKSLPPSSLPPPLLLPPTLLPPSSLLPPSYPQGSLISSRKIESSYRVKGLSDGDNDYEADLISKLVSFKREENFQESLKEALYNLRLTSYNSNEGKQTLVFLIEKLIGLLNVHSNSDFLNFIDLYQNHLLYSNLTLPPPSSLLPPSSFLPISSLLPSSPAPFTLLPFSSVLPPSSVLPSSSHPLPALRLFSLPPSSGEWKRLMVKKEIYAKQWELIKKGPAFKVNAVSVDEASVKQVYVFIEEILKLLIIFFNSK